METTGQQAGIVKRTKKLPSEAAQALKNAMDAMTSKPGAKKEAEPALVTDLEASGVSTSAPKTFVPVSAESSAPVEVLTCIAPLGPGRVCKVKRNPGSMYCWRHAPLDPNSGMVYCHYEDKATHKKCSNAIHITKKPLLCGQHIAKVSLFLDNPVVMNGATPDEVTAFLAAKAPPSTVIVED